MNKLILIIFWFSFISCKNTAQTSDSKNNENDTILLKRGNLKKDFNSELNTVFDTLKVKLLVNSEDLAFMKYSNNLDSSLIRFLEKMFFIDNSLEKIRFYDQTVELYFADNDNTSYFSSIIGDSDYWVFNHYMYHDIYYSLFYYDNVNSVKILISNVDKLKNNLSYRNITYLPLSGDYEILLPNGIMKKKWYKPNTNYWELFENDILDKAESFVGQKSFEIKKTLLDSIFHTRLK